MSFSAGTVWLEVTPSFDGLQNATKLALAKAFAGVSPIVQQEFSKIPKVSEDVGKESGKKFNSTFGRELSSTINELQTTLGTSLDGVLPEAELARFQSAMQDLNSMDLNLPGEMDKAFVSLQGMSGQLNNIVKDHDSGTRRIAESTRANLGSATQVIDRMTAKYDKMAGSSGPVDSMVRDLQKATVAFNNIEATPDMDGEEYLAQAAMLGAQARAVMEAATNNMDMDVNQSEFVSEVVATAVAAEAAAPDIVTRMRLEKNKARFLAEIKEFEAFSKAMAHDIKFDANLDTAKAMAHLMTWKATLEAVAEENTDFDVKVRIAAALRNVAILESSLKKAEIQSTRTGRGLAAIDAGSAANAVRLFNGRLLALVAIGPVLIPMLSATAAGILGIGAAALSVLGAIGLMVAAFSGIPNALKATTSKEKADRVEASKSGTGKKAGKTEQQKVSDERSLDDARTALMRTRRDSAQSLEDSNKRVAQAHRSLADAEEAAAESSASAAEKVVKAQKDVADARKDVAKAADDSAKRIAAAERSLENAQRSAIRAQRALNDARAQGVRDLQDMNNQLKSAQLSERGAEFAIEEAAARYSAMLDDPQATAREKAKAGLDFEQSQQALKEQRLSTKRLEKDTAKANAVGVEGSRSVVDAQESVVDANRSVRDAEVALMELRKEAAADAIRQVDKIAKASDALAKALAAQAKDAKKSARSVQDAEDGLADARQNNARNAIQVSERIADAEQALARVIQDQSFAAADALEGNKALTSAADEYREAMDNLSPAGQRFTAFLLSLRPLLKDLRFAAQESFLPPLQEGMELIIDKYGPRIIRFVEAMGTAMGDMALETAEMFANPFWEGFFDMMIDLGPKFITVLGRIGNSTLTVLAGLIQAFAPFGMEMLEGFASVMEGVADWATTLQDNEGFHEFMDYVREAGPKVVELLGLLGETLIKTLVALAPHAGQMLDAFITFFEWLNGLDPDAFTAVVLAALLLVGAVQAISGVMAALQGTIKLIAGVIGIIGGAATAVILAVIAIGIGLYVLYQSHEGFRELVQKVWAAVVTAVETAWEFLVDIWDDIDISLDDIIEGMEELAVETARVWDEMVTAVTDAWDKYLWPVFDAIISWYKLIWESAKLAWNMMDKLFIQPLIKWWGFLWDKVLKPVFDLWNHWFREVLGPTFTWFYSKIVKPVLDFIGGVFQVVWKIIKTVFDALYQIIKFVIAPVFNWLYNKAIKPVMDWIGDKISTVWNKTIKPIFNALKDYISDKVAPAFKKGRDLLGRIWGGFLDLFKAPIRMGIDLVMNKGLIKAFNWLAGKVPGMTKLNNIPIPAALRKGGGVSSRSRPGQQMMASGGVLPGYTPGRDVHEFTSGTAGRLSLSGGEAIMRPEWVEMIGGEAEVHRQNKMARRGFADGGIFGSLKKFGGKAWGGVKNIASGVSAFFKDPIKALKGIIKSAVKNMGMGSGPVMQALQGIALKPLKTIGKLIGKNEPVEDLFHGASVGAGSGASIGRGVPGYRKMMGMVQALIPGVRVTSTYRPGARTAGYGTLSFHGQGRAIDLAGGPGMSKIWDILNQTYGSRNRELLYTPKGGRQIIGAGGKRGRTNAITSANHYDHVHWAMNQGGILPTLYDKGGDVPPGLSLMANKTGKPEVVLTNKFVEEIRTSLAEGEASSSFDMRGSHFGYDPREVAIQADKVRNDRLALAGVRRIGGI